MRSAWLGGALLAAAHVASADPCRTTLTFAPGRAALSPSGKHGLDPMRDVLRASPELHVEIVAPSDPLAARRAEAAKWYLVDGGVESDRIATATTASSRDALRVRIVGGSCAAMAPAPRPSPGLVGGRASMVEDASALASLLAGDDSPAPPAVHPPSPPSEHVPPPAPELHIGHDDVGFRGGDVAVHADIVPLGLRLASTTLAISTHHEEQVARTSLLDDDAGAVQVDGDRIALDPKHLRPLGTCYRRALGIDPSISNRANLSFGIDKQGKVVAPVAISDTDELDTCLHGAMARWRFAPGKPHPQMWMTVTLRSR